MAMLGGGHHGPQIAAKRTTATLSDEGRAKSTRHVMQFRSQYVIWYCTRKMMPRKLLMN